MNDAGGSIDGSVHVPEPGAALVCAPEPAWADRNPPPMVPEGALEDFTDQGVLRILQDSQINLTEPGVAVHMRVLQRVLTRAGAERAANLAIEFDPAHEHLEVHRIRVWRGDSPTEYARPGAMQLLRRESQLERFALNGRLTASFVVPDLRENDQLEICFTQFSAHPVLSGRYGGWLIFNAYAPWIETRMRLIRPVSRPITLKPFNSPPAPQVRTEGAREELRWSLVGQKRLGSEDLIPSWTVKNPCYQASEFSTWSEVAQLFAPHYQDAVLPAELSAACSAVAATRSDAATNAVEWLRFVQRTLRYFALAFGYGGLLPRDLETIWTGRFGDCKDAARLYVAGARRLGLDACAALVSTTHGISLNDFLPTAQLFNHVIVRLRIADSTYWVDPTLPAQTGPLQQLVVPHAGWALPLTMETDALDALPAALPVELVHCEDRITLGPKVDSPAHLERRMGIAFWAADNVRHRIANDGAAKVATQIMQQLLASWPRAVETKPPSFEEDPHTNQLTLHCGYEIPEPWTQVQDGSRRRALPLVDTVTNGELAKLQVARRHSPILLGRPRRVSWRATVGMPQRWWGKGWQQVLDGPGLRFTSHLKMTGREVVIERQLTVDAWSIAVDQADAYLKVVSKANQNVTQLFARVEFGRIVCPNSPWRRVVASRWRRAVLIAIIFIIYLIAINVR